ncbi:MAG TPA: type VII secretion-associated serine protease mycosin [Amycolatopsis sp.]|uniref:type VII secretion-associated serine protease mycosin n=1 Tax=Amycolatopsis sp. TaxID=37632 RepID=UPI002B464387|nr:type VII secretion-associated serine protease mycosin [Amycolatopsis sp.]HKS49390.1 type VII secretion-associated serine protease mycosin [Amycolatopsis sp.]
MRANRTRPAGLHTRTAAVLLSASLGAFSPLTAAAQTGSDLSWAPPPVNMSLLPNDPGQPDKQYDKKKDCVQRDPNSNIKIQDRPWGQSYLQIEQAQKLVQAGKGSVGGGLTVAVIDTGVTKHAYLNVDGGGDYVHPDNGTQDCDGHGTEVAGIIAADTPPNIGFKGVAPDAKIISIRQTSQNYATQDQQSGAKQGSREQGDGAGNLNTLAQAVVHAANRGDIAVINMSIDNCRSADIPMSPQERALQAAVHFAVEQKNIVVVAAAGNTSETCKQNDDANKPRSIVSPPWFADDVLSVAAIQEDGSVAPFSVHGPWVSVAAPGTNITSLDPADVGSTELANQVVEGGKPGPIQGTSFAAPYVAGLAVLVRQQFPNLNARQVMRRIEVTAQHPGAPGGRDQYIGYGVVNPVAALTAIVPAEEGVAPAAAKQLPSGLPPAAHKDWTPAIVALAGTGGGLVVLLVTLFVVRTIRRNRPA